MKILLLLFGFKPAIDFNGKKVSPKYSLTCSIPALVIQDSLSRCDENRVAFKHNQCLLISHQKKLGVPSSHSEKIMHYKTHKRNSKTRICIAYSLYSVRKEEERLIKNCWKYLHIIKIWALELTYRMLSWYEHTQRFLMFSKKKKLPKFVCSVYFFIFPPQLSLDWKNFLLTGQDYSCPSNIKMIRGQLNRSFDTVKGQIV